MHRLRTILSGHELDVRGVATISDTQVASCSRDGTARVWDVATGASETFFRSNTFINCVEHVPELGLIAVAGKDAIIYLCEPHELYAKPGHDVGRYQLVGHTNNVCVLRSGHGQLVSALWDGTAKVWDLATFTVKYDLVGHAAAVWDAVVVDADTVLTCSADRTIRRWHRGVEVAQYRGHSDVVRRLALLPHALFVSASNDGLLKVWDLDSGVEVQTLKGHASFVYDVAVLADGALVSLGEDRTVCVWRGGRVAQALAVPGVLAWCVAVLADGSDVAVGTSDHHIYVFSADPARAAPADVAEAYAHSVSAAAIPEQAVDGLNKTDVPGYERLATPGKQEGEVVMVKSAAGAVEAHQWSGGRWVKIGDVVSAAGSSSKKTYNGREYDYVFDVDVEDGKPPLKLPFNATDNPYTAAELFLADNDLPALYADQVVQFIAQNTEGVLLDLAPAASAPASGSAAAPARAATSARPAAHTELLTFKDYKPEQLVRGFNKFNSAQATPFPADTVARVELALHALVSQSALFLVNDIVPTVLAQWQRDQKLIALDMLRIAIPRITVADLILSTDTAENLLRLLLDSFDDIGGDPTLVMMMAKILCNLMNTILFAQLFLTSEGSLVVFNEFFEDYTSRFVLAAKLLTTTPENASHKQYANALVAVSAFLFNLSAFPSKNSMDPSSLVVVTGLFDEVADDIVRANEEAAYRLCLSVGNLLAGAAQTPLWYTVCQQLYTSLRFQQLYAGN